MPEATTKLPVNSLDEENFKIEIGLSMRFLRRSAEITQKQLAAKLGMKSPSYICELEKGLKMPTSYLLYRIEKILGDVYPRSNR